MKQIMKKMPGLLGALCLMAAFMPQTAMADGTGELTDGVGAKGISLGAANVSVGNRIYFGSFQGYYAIHGPILWRVLKNGDGKATLISADSLLTSNYSSEESGNNWQGSSGWCTCQDFYLNWEDSVEKKAILATTVREHNDYSVTDGSSSDHFSYYWQGGDWLTYYGAAPLNNEHFFYLSAKEASLLFKGNDDRKASSAWWLRSPYAMQRDCVGCVSLNGELFFTGGERILGNRPAFNLDLASVLLTSAAAGGKNSGSAGSDGLTEVSSSYTGSEWKLTLFDDTRSGFSAEPDGMSGGVAAIKYSGAKAGTDEYISAVIADSSGEITYYGNLAPAEEGDGKIVTVDLAGKYKDGDTLYVFNEKKNGDKLSDYSSELKKIDIGPLPETLNIEITGNSGTVTYNGAEQSVLGFIAKYKLGEADWTETAPEGAAITLKTGTLAEAKGTNADTYTMGLTEASFDINTGSYIPGTVSVTDGSLTIGKASLTITANDQEYVYNGETQGEGDTAYEDPAQIAEKVTADKLQGNDYLYSVVLDGQGKEAGEYEIVPSNAVIYRDGKAVTDNYELTYVNGKMTITEPAVSYTVSFSAGGGSGAMDEVPDVAGDYDLPECLFTAPDGKTFDCWLVDGSEYAEGDTITVESDITVTAQWKDASGHVHNLKLVEAKDATCTEAGNKAYYTCDGCDLWFEDKTGLVEITDKSSVIIKALGHDWGEWKQTKPPTTTEEGEETRTCSRCGETETRSVPKLDTNSYTVTFNANGHGTAPASQTVESGNKASEPAALTASGYTFGGWYKEAACTNKFSFDALITGDITLYAKWTANSSGGGSSGGESSSGRRPASVSGSWSLDASGWTYRENGIAVSGAWRFLLYNGRNDWYYFDENGIMRTGWLDWKGDRYYLDPVSNGWMGRMLTGWQLIEGKWYYFETAAGSTQGRMYRGERTPDGYYVGADGAWDGNPANAGR